MSQMKTYEFELQFFLTKMPEFESESWKEFGSMLHEFVDEHSREGFEVFSTGVSAGVVSFGFQVAAESLDRAIILAASEDYSGFPFRKETKHSVAAFIWVEDLPEFLYVPRLSEKAKRKPEVCGRCGGTGTYEVDSAWLEVACDRCDAGRAWAKARGLKPQN